MKKSLVILILVGMFTIPFPAYAKSHASYSRVYKVKQVNPYKGYRHLHTKKYYRGTIKVYRA